MRCYSIFHEGVRMWTSVYMGDAHSLHEKSRLSNGMHDMTLRHIYNKNPREGGVEKGWPGAMVSQCCVMLLCCWTAE